MRQMYEVLFEEDCPDSKMLLSALQYAWEGDYTSALNELHTVSFAPSYFSTLPPLHTRKNITDCRDNAGNAAKILLFEKLIEKVRPQKYN